MVKYWAMAPATYSPSGTIRAEYQKCWQYDLEHGVIAMGWDLGEAPNSRDHLNRLWDTNAKPCWKSDPKYAIGQLGKFWFDVEPGDIVIAGPDCFATSALESSMENPITTRKPLA